MVSHPETGSDPPIGSDRESGRDTEGREDFAPEGPGISDLISSEYVRGLHLTNFRFTFSSSELRLG